MKKNLLNSCLLLLSVLIFPYPDHASSIGNEVPTSSDQLKVLPFLPSEVKLLQSPIEKRELLNTSLLHRFDVERLLHNFRINAGIKSEAKPLEGWESPGCGLRGHFVGHYLSACASVLAWSNDTLLSNRIKYMIDELEKCQQKLGGKYLSAFPESEFDTLEKKYGGVWAPYYTYHKILQGLLDVYAYTGNLKALQLAMNMADYVKCRMDKLKGEQIEKILYSAEANPTNEAGGMNEVLYNLYAISHNPEHLKLARLFDRKWFYQPLIEGKDILSGLHSNTHIVLVNGFVRRFENTGETDFQKAAMNFWDMLVYHHAYVNGSSSGPRPISTTPTSRVAEHWGHADHLSATLTGQIAESCVTHNTQKLTSGLFQLTADPKFADAYMNTFYNAVMALQNGENGKTVYHLPLGSPRKKEFLQENDFKCCNGSGIEAFTHLNSNIYFRDHTNLWINMYVPSLLNWKEKGVKVQQITDFPEDGKIHFKISVQKPTQFALRLLIPSWADSKTKVLINGIPFRTRLKPAAFAILDRKWFDGDTVDLVFDFDFHIKSMPDNDRVIALYYGAVLLAFDTNQEIILKGDKQTILQNLRKKEGEFSFILENGGKTYQLRPFYTVTDNAYGVYGTIRNEY